MFYLPNLTVHMRMCRMVDAWTRQRPPECAGLAGGAWGLPIIFTRYHNYPGSKFERLLDWTEVQHAPNTELLDELSPLAGGALAVVDKTGYSVFTAEVAKLVEDHGWG